jgi:anti-sigma-K factor RskA
MSCSRIDDAGAYVLYALEDDEAADFATHLSTCAACRKEVADLQVVVDTLPLAAPVEMPSAALRSRIMTVVESEAQLLRAAGPKADAPPTRRRERRGLGGRLAALRPLPAASLATVLIALGIGGGILIDRSGAPDTKTMSATIAAAGASGKLHITNGHIELALSKMPPPPKGRVYQVWLKRDGGAPQPTHTLFNVRNDGQAVVRVDEKANGADELLVTAERSGGSMVPTSQPVLTARL